MRKSSQLIIEKDALLPLHTVEARGLGEASQLSEVQERGTEVKDIGIVVMKEAMDEVGWVLEKSKINLNCCHMEQARQLIRMNKRISEQAMLNSTDL